MDRLFFVIFLALGFYYMPCFHPLQATFSVRFDGKKDVRFSNINAEKFQKGVVLSGDNNLSLPCGRCMGCRLERSRQWALRCWHESQLHEENSFITLTYAPEFLPADGSLDRKHFQDFMKRLRFRFSDRVIRVFYCGEYGENFGRPHYHACLFGIDFDDKKKEFQNGCDDWVYSSELLSSFWTFGISRLGMVTFESAGYVARYCTKKVTGSAAEEHYQGRIPEFCGMSLKPGIGRGFIDKFGKSDVFPFDECVVRGHPSKPPRYYDKVLEAEDPQRFFENYERRVERAEKRAADNTYQRLLDREICQEARFKKLIRRMENGTD